MSASQKDVRRELLQLLEARIAFRRRWIMSQAPKRKTVKPEHIEALALYDDANNFARMGAEFVDETWGIALPRAPKRRRRDAVADFQIAA